MGYACPVCETPQADGRHLANHLAFTAMIHGDAHEAWLTEHAPEWQKAGERELAERVIENATEIEFPPSGDSGGDGRGPQHGDDAHHHSHGVREHDHDQSPGDGHGRNRERSRVGDRGRGRGPTDVAIDSDVQGESAGGEGPDVAAVLAEARELTRRMGGGENPTKGGEGASKGGSEQNRDEERRNETSDHEERNDGRSG